MSVRLFGGLLGSHPASSAVAASRRVRRLCDATRAAAATLVLFGPLLACEPLPSANLANLVRVGDPVPLIDALARLGHTMDLSRFRQVRASIGDVEGASVFRRQDRAEGETGVSYEFPTGDILYNPDLPNQYYLLVSLHSCVPAQLVRERLRGPEFAQPASRIAVAIYTDVPYADRSSTAFTYHTGGSNCITSFGLAQWKRDPRHNP